MTFNSIKINALKNNNYIFLLYLSVYFLKYGFKPFILSEFILDLFILTSFAYLFLNSFKYEKAKNFYLALILVISIITSIYNYSASVLFIFCSVAAESFKSDKTAVLWLSAIAISIVSITIIFSLPAYFWLVAGLVSVIVVVNKRIEKYRDEKNKTLSYQKIWYATYKERERLSQDLHDSLGILLSKGVLLAQVAAYKDKKLTLDSKQKFEQLEILMRQSLESIRRVITNSHTCDFSKQIAEIQETLNLAQIKTNITIDAEIQLNESQKQQVLYIINESTANIIKHSNANECEIQFTKENNEARLIIKNNGYSLIDWNKSNGLNNIKSRVENLSGNYTITNDDGFNISTTFPLKHDYKNNNY
ncbi:sensor histidine kinase [Microbulbifer sp. 2304DJ12-6]|uniref:sensor histidine kinase n=1 Tax=Microbulbifer sp. 2304DJ12-6 TaxID=3233340 RepID=UPI0039AF5503